MYIYTFTQYVSKRIPTFTIYSYFFWVKGMLHICKEGCIFLKNFIPSKHSFLGIVQVQAFIGYTFLFGQ